jgi:uncharacterized repeat protein (TIGR01451 family)
VRACLRAGVAGICAALLLTLPGTAAALPQSSQGARLAPGFVDPGGSHVCAVLEGGSTHCWGENGFGELGIGAIDDRGDEPDELPAPPVVLGDTAQVSAGGFSSCAVRVDGTVLCWGRNNVGQLGNGDTDNIGDDPEELPRAVPLPAPANEVSVGSVHACAVITDGTVQCWGGNLFGMLGLGDTENRGDNPGELPTAAVPLPGPAQQVVSGDAFSCALLTDGTVHCWGAGKHLGVGVVTTEGDDPGELPTPAVPLPGPAQAITAGLEHTCALLVSGAVHCWGVNDSGQLGIGDTATRGDSPGELPTPAVPLPATATAIAAGDNHTCAVLSTGVVRCWGANASGQLGSGNTHAVGDDPGETPVQPPSMLAVILAVSAGGDTTCLSYSGGTIDCWGKNASGQLGIGATENRGDQDLEVPTPAVPLRTSVRRAGDLSLETTVDKPNVVPGDKVQLTYDLRNIGPSRLSRVVVGAGLPGLKDVTATATPGSFDSSSQTWRVGALVATPGPAVPPGATLTVTGTVTAAGTFSETGEVLGSDALDGDSIPANGDPAEDDRGAANITVAPVTITEPPKVAPDALTLKAAKKRDARRPYAFKLSGRLVALATPLRDACAGRVTIAAKRSGKTAATAQPRLALSRKTGLCSYKATLKLGRKAKKGAYTATAAFPGRGNVAAKSSPGLRLRAG